MGFVHTMGISVLSSATLHWEKLFTLLEENAVLWELLHTKQNGLGQAMPSATTIKYKT